MSLSYPVSWKYFTLPQLLALTSPSRQLLAQLGMPRPLALFKQVQEPLLLSELAKLEQSVDIAIALYSVGQNETLSLARGFVGVLKVSALYSVGQNRPPSLAMGVLKHDRVVFSWTK